MKAEEIKSVLLEALKGAGALILDSVGKIHSIGYKTELSLVTETDLACERIILEIIRKSFPDHALLTEESPAMGKSEARWIIDPLDGTTNFAHGFPVAAVSIGFEYKGVLEAGGVFDPFRNELFFAQRGKGATLNDKPIHVSKTDDISHALLATGFPYDRREHADQYLARVKAFMLQASGIRRAGAAAIDLCYVACGRFDGFWEAKLNSWDKAAGMLIVQEAGGRTTDFQGNPLTVDSETNLASNGLIHETMLQILKS